MKLVGFVVLGFVASVIIYFLLGYMFEKFFPENAYPNFYGWGGFWRLLLIITPVAFLLGSILTGFLSCPELNSKWWLLAIAPGLYPALMVTFSILLGRFAGSPRGFVYILFLFFVLLYLASLAGVASGYFLRALINRWYYSD